MEQIKGASVDEALNISLNDFLLDHADDLEQQTESELSSWPVVHPLIFLFHEAVYGSGNLKGGKVIKQVSPKDLVCFCFGLSKSEIELDLKNKTPLKAGTLCQSCQVDITEIAEQFENTHSPQMQTYQVQDKKLTYAQMVLFLKHEIEEFRENRDFFPTVEIIDLKFNELTLRASSSTDELKDYFAKKLELNLHLIWKLV